MTKPKQKFKVLPKFIQEINFFNSEKISDCEKIEYVLENYTLTRLEQLYSDALEEKEYHTFIDKATGSWKKYPKAVQFLEKAIEVLKREEQGQGNKKTLFPQKKINQNKEAREADWIKKREALYNQKQQLKTQKYDTLCEDIEIILKSDKTSLRKIMSIKRKIKEGLR